MENTTKPGYLFGGWFIDPELTKRINPSGVLPGDTTLYPKWIPEVYTISYELEEGMNSLLNPRAYTIESGIQKLYPAISEGRQFSGWFLDGERVDYLHEGHTGPIHLVGKFQDHISVQFETCGGNRLPEAVTNDSGYLAALPTPLRLGFTFDGWFLDPEYTHPWSSDRLFLKPTVLYARWKLAEFTIRYDLNGGQFTSRPTTRFTRETTTFLLPTARRQGFEFEGWKDERGNHHLLVRKGSIRPLRLKACWKRDPAKTILIR